MCDTFRPLRLTQLSHALDDGEYALSWYRHDDSTPKQANATGAQGGTGTGAGVTSQL